MKKTWIKPKCQAVSELMRPIETVFICNSGDWKPKPPWERPYLPSISFLTRCKEVILGRRPHSV